MYTRKTKDEYQLLVNYGFGDGYECETTYDTYAEAKQGKREYNANCHYLIKIVKKRIKINN